jgi:hypothetical protein
VDTTFNPNASAQVYSVSVQADGKILLGGFFGSVGGVSRNNFARLPNEPATQTLTVTGTTRVDWQRGGSAPEVSQVTFESWNGTAWVALATPVRVPGGWRATGLSLPTSGSVRARGRTSGGYLNGSSALVESLVTHAAIVEGNAVGAVLATLEALDANAEGPFTYSLVGGVENPDNAALSIEGDKLKAAITFNYELRNSYSVRVRVADAIGNHYERALVVSVLDGPDEV